MAWQMAHTFKTVRVGAVSSPALLLKGGHIVNPTQKKGARLEYVPVDRC